MDVTGLSKKIRLMQFWFIVSHGKEQSQKQHSSCRASTTEPCAAFKLSVKRKGEEISSSGQLKFSKRRCKEENDGKVN